MVSTLEASLGSNGARIRRKVSNSTPRKNLWLLISSADTRPSRFSELQTRLVHTKLDCQLKREQSGVFIPSNEIFGFRSKLNILREVEIRTPGDNLSICVMGIFGTERRPSDLTFEHDRTETPPIAIIGITMSTENFWSNIIGCTNSRVSHDSSRLSPVIDNASVANCEVDLVKID